MFFTFLFLQFSYFYCYLPNVICSPLTSSSSNPIRSHSWFSLICRLFQCSMNMAAFNETKIRQIQRHSDTYIHTQYIGQPTGLGGPGTTPSSAPQHLKWSVMQDQDFVFSWYKAGEMNCFLFELYRDLEYRVKMFMINDKYNVHVIYLSILLLKMTSLIKVNVDY